MAVNHCLNASFELPLDTTWQDDGGNSVLERAGFGDIPDGSWFAKLECTGAGSRNFRTHPDSLIPVTEGEEWTHSAFIKWGIGTAKPMHIDVRWFDVNKVEISSDNGGAFTPAGSAWLRIPNNDNVAPAGAAYVGVRYACGTMAIGDTFLVDAVMVEKGNADPPSQFVRGPDEPVATPTSTGVTFGAITDEVLATLEGYGLNQGRSAFLGQQLDPAELSFKVGDVSNLAEGLAEIGDELIYIQSVDKTSEIVTISPDGRGYRGSGTKSHDINSRLTMNPVFPRALAKRKVNEAIIGLWPDLWGESTTSFQHNPHTASYEMPTGTEDVVSVRYEELGGTKEWPHIRNWELDRHADPTTFPSGVSLTIRDWNLWPGRTIRVVYRHQPAELVTLADALTVSGLQNTARAAIVYGAAERLVRGMDPSRLAVNTAQASEYADQNPVGTAVQVATFLRRHYEQELADERRRQELRSPPIFHYTENYL